MYPFDTGQDRRVKPNLSSTFSIAMCRITHFQRVQLRLSPVTSQLTGSFQMLQLILCDQKMNLGHKHAAVAIGLAKGGTRKPCPQVSGIPCRSVLWEAVSQTKYCCSLKVKIFVPKKIWAGNATGCSLQTRLSTFLLCRTKCSQFETLSYRSKKINAWLNKTWKDRIVFAQWHICSVLTSGHRNLTQKHLNLHLYFILRSLQNFSCCPSKNP